MQVCGDRAGQAITATLIRAVEPSRLVGRGGSRLHRPAWRQSSGLEWPARGAGHGPGRRSGHRRRAAALPLAAAPEARVALAGQSPAIDPARVVRLRQMMTANVGVIRDETGLRRAHAGIADLEPGAAPAFANMLAADRMIATAGLLRRESRGAHYRSDFPGSLPPLPSRLTLAEAIALKEFA